MVQLLIFSSPSLVTENSLAVVEGPAFANTQSIFARIRPKNTNLCLQAFSCLQCQSIDFRHVFFLYRYPDLLTMSHVWSCASVSEFHSQRKLLGISLCFTQVKPSYLFTLPFCLTRTKNSPKIPRVLSLYTQIILTDALTPGPPRALGCCGMAVVIVFGRQGNKATHRQFVLGLEERRGGRGTLTT